MSSPDADAGKTSRASEGVRPAFGSPKVDDGQVRSLLRDRTSGRRRGVRALAWITLATTLMAMTACGSSEPEVTSAPPRAAVQQGELDIDGQVRTYRVFAPTTLEPENQPPLVLVLGGVGNSAEIMVSATEFDRSASINNFVAAYPEGIDLTWNAGF